MPQENPLISIIILNWNGKEYLKDCLLSVFNQTYDNFKVIFVDNHSTDDSVGFVRQNFSKAEIVALDDNYGFAKGNNIGIKYTLEKYNPDYIFLLNNDTKILQKDALKKLIEIAENDKKIGILGCKLIYPNGKIQHAGTAIDLLSQPGVKNVVSLKAAPQGPYEVYATMGAAFLIKRAVINRIGLFDKGFSPLYYEELDYCVRARKAGFIVKIDSSVEIAHYYGRSSQDKAPRCLDFIFRTNAIRFALLNFPLPLLIVKLFYDCYALLRNLPADILERKNKGANLALANLKIRQDCWNNSLLTFASYLTNIKNLGDIAYKRIFRTKKIC